MIQAGTITAEFVGGALDGTTQELCGTAASYEIRLPAFVDGQPVSAGDVFDRTRGTSWGVEPQGEMVYVKRERFGDYVHYDFDGLSCS